MPRSLISHRLLHLTAVLAAVLVASAAGGRVAPAHAASCADQVLADWYDDGRVGKIYPLACYRQAIANLSPDILDYSNAAEEIGRALAFAQQGKPDPGGEDPTPATTPAATTTSPASTSTTKTSTSKTTTTKTASTKTSTTATSTAGTTSTTDTSGPSSVPVPLLVLGGIAVLLLAAGSAGYLRRRMGDDEGDGTPPASA